MAKTKKKWTNDRKELVSVEKTRDSIKFVDDKGKVRGGREYYGVPVEQK